ncbi:dynamin-related protein 3A-like isoform X3 [Nymphaea colorata]|uniref:dynamin-related protein 3A-like isoform X3 n=1 Tax=Nymphaea colorata TaxID=210225 RepID=UPI00129EEC65|nr:dynamin-related protein 3A-like isoform X3 [Nymphaea colorata]
MGDFGEAEKPAPSSNAAVGSIGQSVIPIVNKLQDIFSQLGSSSTIELPQVSVVGSQSSGKSSVLEALVGRDFLPRGTDICTRRPLVLQLVHTPRPAKQTEGSEWGEFLHLPGKRFFDFSAIRREIQAETEREVGANKGVSDKQIRLKVFSPNVLNITLVDLPGITKVPVGDQPTDIEARIRTMILSYIKHETCIILAVTPANSDLANSDALQMARIADPDGSRTIGVITKLDIMDRGTDARNFLLGNVIPLRLGYVGVVNRSQEDIIYNRSIQEALANEEDFFRSRPVYHGLSDRCGVHQLAKKLNQILVQHIRRVLPGLKARINIQMVAVAKELASYGEITESKAGQGALVLNILTKYSEAFSSLVEGKHEELSTTELSGGARIHYIFQSIFVKSLEEVDPCDDLSDEDIRTTIQNAAGPKNALFVPEVPFEVLVRRQICRLLDPSLQCARFIYDELIKMDYINTSHPNFIGGSKAVEIAVQQFKSRTLLPSMPKLKVQDAVDPEKMIDKNKKGRSFFSRSSSNGNIAEQVSQDVRPVANNERPKSCGGAHGGSWLISSIFGGSDAHSSTKQGSIYNSNSDLLPNMELPSSIIQLKEPPAMLRPSATPTEEEAIEMEVTKLLLKSYFDVVRKNIEDYVPKAIMHFLVNYAKRDLHSVFIRELYRENLFEEMLQEPEEIATKRKQSREMFRVLQQAFRTLDELPLHSETIATGSMLGSDSTGLPRVHGLPQSFYSTGNGDEILLS